MTDLKVKSFRSNSDSSDSQDQRPELNLWEGSSAVVEQGRHWSSALIWTFCILFGSSLIWAFTAKLDQTITVRGRLVPAGRVREETRPGVQLHHAQG